MIDVCFVMLFFLVPVFSFGIIRLSRIDIFRVSVPSMFILSYLAVSYIGILFLYFGWDSRALAQGVNDKELVLKMFCLSAATMFLISIGFSFMPVVLRVLKRTPSLSIPARPLKQISLTVVACVFALSSLAIYFYMKYLPDVPLFHVFMGDPQGAVYARITSLAINKVVIGRASYYNLFIRMIMPFLCYILFAEAFISKRRFVKLMFGICFVITAFGNVLDTAKGPLFGLLLGLCLTYVVLKGQKLRLRTVLFMSLFLVVIVGVMYSFFMGTGGSIWDRMVGVGRRASVGNLVPSYHVLEMFEHRDYLLGKSFPNPRGILPYEQYLLGQEIWRRLNPSSSPDVLYTAPPVFWAEMYANFGPSSVLTALLIGIFLYIIHLLLDRLPHNSVRFALIVWCALHYAGKGLFGYFWDYYAIGVLLIGFFVLLVDGGGVIKLQRLVAPRIHNTLG